MSFWNHSRGLYGYLAAITTLMIVTRFSAAQDSGSKVTEEFPPAHWQRTLGAPPGAQYLGRAVCASCHFDVAGTQAQTSMGRTSIDAAKSAYLSKHPRLAYQDGAFLIRIERKAGREIYAVTDGQHTLSLPIQWAFGVGNAQTYVLERDGTYYESRVSYYSDIDGLGLTIGHDHKPSPTLGDALGRALSQDEQLECFPCHTSEGVLNGKLQPSRMQPGVTCENCHGPGSQHVESVKNRDWKHLRIFNPGRLATADLNDFCGSCHHSTREVAALGLFGIKNVRFQPYRLEGSRCYDPNDKRITCLACHDPHVQIVTDTRTYDSKCLACHISAGEQISASRKAPACPRATKDCAGCHMPRLALPGAHHKFADHLIRVYRPDETYPD